MSNRPYFKCVAVLADGTKVLYRGVTNPGRLGAYCVQNCNPPFLYLKIYLLPYREAKQGTQVAIFTQKHGVEDMATFLARKERERRQWGR